MNNRSFKAELTMPDGKKHDMHVHNWTEPVHPLFQACEAYYLYIALTYLMILLYHRKKEVALYFRFQYDIIGKNGCFFLTAKYEYNIVRVDVYPVICTLCQTTAGSSAPLVTQASCEQNFSQIMSTLACMGTYIPPVAQTFIGLGMPFTILATYDGTVQCRTFNDVDFYDTSDPLRIVDLKKCINFKSSTGLWINLRAYLDAINLRMTQGN